MARGEFAPFRERMLAEKLPEIAIRTFEHYYHQLAAGETGMIAETEIQPVPHLPDLEQLPASLGAAGRRIMSRAILLKLNGGLGTGMGLAKAKSLLQVKDGFTFLDIIARQAIHAGIPLVLMNSFSTRDDSLAALARYDALRGEIPLDFLQHKAPKVRQADLRPVDWPADAELEWCPPGHGDIYTALLTSGLLRILLDRGYEFAFVSNADNLGAELDPRILGYCAQNSFPFLMEVADRTAADRKGGHLAQRKSDGRLILRESAQCPAADVSAFQDIARHRYFNTNNLWLNLPALQRLLDERGGVLGLPMICNSKTVDPRDGTSPGVYQLETAMGAAIALFERATALRVPRTRFAPVKATDDLLAVRSDAYVLSDDWQIAPNPARAFGAPVVVLDAKYYKLIDDLEARFPFGPPSLLACERFTVTGDVKFGAGVSCAGVVEVINEGAAQVELTGQILCDQVRFRA